MDDLKTDPIDQVKAQDLTEAQIAQELSPKKTWFFERTGDGMTFACQEREAWDIVNNRSEWRRHDFKLIGVSSGETYVKVVRESKVEADRLEPELVDLRGQLKQYQSMREKMMIDEIIDLDDLTDPVNAVNVAKIKRLDGIIKKVSTKLKEKESEWRKLVGQAVRRATDAELEQARGNIEWPQNQNIITPNASPQERQKILRAMGRL